MGEELSPEKGEGEGSGPVPARIRARTTGTDRTRSNYGAMLNARVIELTARNDGTGRSREKVIKAVQWERRQ